MNSQLLEVEIGNTTIKGVIYSITASEMIVEMVEPFAGLRKIGPIPSNQHNDYIDNDYLLKTAKDLLTELYTDLQIVIQDL